LRNVGGVAHRRNCLRPPARPSAHPPADIPQSNNQFFPSENLVKNQAFFCHFLYRISVNKEKKFRTKKIFFLKKLIGSKNIFLSGQDFQVFTPVPANVLG
jgi:hypothetical protein